MPHLSACLLLACLLLTACHAAPPQSAAPQQPPPPPHALTTFEIESDFGEESAWVAPYLARCAAALTTLMDNPDLAPPDSIKVELRKIDDHRGIGGWAAAPSGEVPGHPGLFYQPFLIGFESAHWSADKHRRWIIAHEMVNIFAHHYGGAGGYPSDFWSNGRSPFPEYLSSLVMREAGFPDDAAWRRDINLHKPDHALYWTLHDQYGFALFARFFKLLRADNVRIGDLGAPENQWPAPDPTRSLYTIAYLSIAAGKNLAPTFREAGIGTMPDDWKHGIRSGVPFREYEVRDTDIAAIMAARQRLFGENITPTEALEAQRDHFRKGQW